MVCESVDPEDPYAIDQTSISDSLVMFMRSKQSVAELRKGAAMSGVVASSESAAAGAKSIIEDDVVRETIVAVGSGSGAGLTEVQIGSAVEGEDEGGLACYRSWKSVKRGFSQIAPEDLGSNGLGTGGMF